LLFDYVDLASAIGGVAVLSSSARWVRRSGTAPGLGAAN